jgi:putative SOS response-associated peptidase YedK
MCGRFGLTRPEKLKLERFGITGLPEDVEPRYNISPGTDVLVIRERKSGREATRVRWGLVPWWAEDPAVGARLANARSEGAFEKPAFKEPMRKRRCLIPADVFYEWQAIRGQKRKQPFAVGLRTGEPFALGGIWDFWAPRDGAEGIMSCAILTTEPNVLLSTIHDRMPVIVPEAGYQAWLDPLTPEPAVQELVQPFPSERLRAWPISLRVNRTEEDDAGLLDPVEPPAPATEQLELGS